MVVTAAPGRARRWSLRHRGVQSTALMSNVGHFGIGTVSLLLIGISAWGGIIPFVGPSFGYSADGTGSWHWSLTHAVVALVPGAIGVFIGIMVLAGSRGLVVGRGRMSLAGAGLLIVACGAWFVAGPWAWPVIEHTRSYFVFASPLRTLANLGGYALGPGVIVASCGAFFIGWASRHQSNAGTVVTREATATPTGSVPVEP